MLIPPVRLLLDSQATPQGSASVHTADAEQILDQVFARAVATQLACDKASRQGCGGRIALIRSAEAAQGTGPTDGRRSWSAGGGCTATARGFCDTQPALHLHVHRLLAPPVGLSWQPSSRRRQKLETMQVQSKPCSTILARAKHPLASTLSHQPRLWRQMRRLGVQPKLHEAQDH